MTNPVLKIPKCLQQAEIIFDTQNDHNHIFLGKNERSFLTAFVEIRIPLPDSMEVIEMWDFEIREFFHKLTNGSVIGKK